jgi:hypothetical protein
VIYCRHAILVFALIACAATLLRAENVDLSTVPSRNSVQLTIYNSEDITLVRETRAVTLKKGVNPLQFSWANTLIDPTSVDLKFLTNADKLEVVDTTFPHAKPQMLYWNVQSEIDGEAKIQITYFTSGITWSADYLGIADKDEKQMSLDGFVRVFNNSGEEYEDAQVRLVVGKINLVEKIAQLANIAEDKVKDLKDGVLNKLSKEAALDFAERGDAALKYGLAVKSPQEKQIVKEGLSEYFIYTIEGTETIKNGWSKRMWSLEGKQVPFQIEYRYRPQEYGDQLVRMYLLKNDEASKLGTTPLPDGVFRIFRDNGREGLSYLVQQNIKYIPIGDKIELNLGRDPEVLFEHKKLKVSRDNLWLQINGKKEFRKIGEDGVKVEEKSSLVGWDDHEVFSQRIRNYSGKDIQVEVRRTLPGHIVFRSLLKPKLHDYQTVEFKAQVAAGKTADLFFEVVRHQGRNAKQNNITLENAEIKP